MRCKVLDPFKSFCMYQQYTVNLVHDVYRCGHTPDISHVFPMIPEYMLVPLLRSRIHCMGGEEGTFSETPPPPIKSYLKLMLSSLDFTPPMSHNISCKCLPHLPHMYIYERIQIYKLDKVREIDVFKIDLRFHYTNI